MSWNFMTDPAFAAELAWVEEFVREEVEPLDLLLAEPADKDDVAAARIVRPLQDEVRKRGLWAAHLGPELGGQGYGQVKLALLNEILGRSYWAPTVFGSQPPDSGNSEILAHYGTPEQKRLYLEPLLAGEISSAYSMTEPHAGADPSLFTTGAVSDGDEWVLNGEKWFTTNARYARFLVVLAVTEPGKDVHAGMSMFLVPTDTPGVNIVRNVGLGTEPAGHGTHGYVRYTDVRLPLDAMLGERGAAFGIAQARLAGGRLHHAMRTVGLVRQAFDMMCERAVSRRVRDGAALAAMQTTQERIADSWVELEQFRLLVLQTAWQMDNASDPRHVRKHIAAVKIAMPKVLHDVAQRALHLHGSLGVSNEMPFATMMVWAEVMGLADGPTEVHRGTLAREVLRDYAPVDPVWPSGHLPTRLSAARERFGQALPAPAIGDV